MVPEFENPVPPPGWFDPATAHDVAALMGLGHGVANINAELPIVIDWTSPFGIAFRLEKSALDASQSRTTFTLQGVITPTALAANTDDYAPTGGDTAHTWRISASAAYNLTGMGFESAGMLRELINVGSFTITLKNDVTSTAAKRFLMDADYSLAAATSALFWYDTTSSRWRLVATGKAASAGGATSPLTTKGDIWVYSTLDTRLGVGSNGQVLLAASGETTGLKWGAVIVAEAGSGGAGGGASLTGGVGDTNAAGGGGSLAGGAGNGSGTGGAATLTGGAGGATGGGGAATLAGGAAGGGNNSGGAGSLTGGAGAGTGAGGAASLAGGISGSGATGNGGAASLTGGAAASTNGSGGAGSLIGGAATGNGTGGAITITGGASAGASGTAGSVTINPGAATGGTAGTIGLGTTNSCIVTIGTGSWLALPQATPTAAGQLAYSTSTGLLSYYNGVTSAAYSLPHWNQQFSEPSTYQVGTTDIESWHITGQVNANHAGFSTKTLADNGLYAIPFLSGHGGTLDRIAFYCQGTFGTNKVMLGIYEAVSSTNRYPGSKLVAATEVTTAAAGAGWSGVIASSTNMIYTISQALTPGKLYWMVLNCDVGSSLVVGSVGQTWNIFGSTSTLSAPTNRCWLEGTRTYDSTLPATFTSAIATSTNVQMPSIFRRYSA